MRTSPLTVNSRTPGVDQTFAPPEVLRRLPAMDEGAIVTLLQARASRSAKPLIMLDNAFTITAEANGPDGFTSGAAQSSD